VVLSHARDKGVEFCADLPLVPTLLEVKDYLSRRASGGGGGDVPPGALRPQRGRGKITDSPQEGEHTMFLGSGTRLGVASPQGAAVRNAIGFFLYTRCKQNATGEWPAVLGCAPC
jgi:hypothetical protein